MNTCIFCSNQTTGSVGRAGLRWSFICQPCKDKEDAALESQLTHGASSFAAVFGKPTTRENYMEITFSASDDFAAYHEACAWLKTQGYSYGSMCSPMPTAIVKGDVLIAKWKNLTATQRASVDGTITTKSNFRHGPITVTIK